MLKSPVFFFAIVKEIVLKNVIFWEVLFSSFLPDSTVSKDISIYHLKFVQKKKYISYLLQKSVFWVINWFSLVAEET